MQKTSKLNQSKPNTPPTETPTQTQMKAPIIEQDRTGQPEVGPATQETAPGAEMPGLAGLPVELKKQIFERVITSENTSAPELAKRWASMNSISHDTTELLGELIREPELAAVANEAMALQSAHAIESALAGTAGKSAHRTGFVVPESIQQFPLARLRVMEIAPPMLGPVIQALAALPAMAMIEIDFGASAAPAGNPAPAAQDRPRHGTPKSAFTHRFALTCTLLREQTLLAKSNTKARLALNLNQATLTTGQLQVLALTLEKCGHISALSLRNSHQPPEAMNMVMHEMINYKVDSIDLANSLCFESEPAMFTMQLTDLINYLPMKRVDISANRIAHPLAGANVKLLQTARVETLIMDGNGLDDRHIEHLKGAFEAGTKVITLSLQNNAFSEGGKASLRAAADAANRPITLLF